VLPEPLEPTISLIIRDTSLYFHAVRRKRCLETASAQACLQSCLSVFVTGLAHESKHILFIAFHTGLVEGVNCQQVAADGACLPEEVDQAAQIVGIQFIHFYHSN